MMGKLTWNSPVPKPTEPEYVWFLGNVYKVNWLLYHEEGTYCLNGTDINGKIHEAIYVDYEYNFPIATKAEFLSQIA